MAKAIAEADRELTLTSTINASLLLDKLYANLHNAYFTYISKLLLLNKLINSIYKNPRPY